MPQPVFYFLGEGTLQGFDTCAVNRRRKRVYGSFDNIFICSDAPDQFAMRRNSHIGKGFGRRAAGKGVLCIFCQFVRNIEMLLNGNADRVQTPVSVCRYNICPFRGCNGNSGFHTVLLAEMAFRYMETARNVVIGFFEYTVNPFCG